MAKLRTKVTRARRFRKLQKSSPFSKFLYALATLFFLAWIALVFYFQSSMKVKEIVVYPGQHIPGQQLNNANDADVAVQYNVNAKSVNSKSNSNPWEGWQPSVIPSTGDCSWRNCFKLNHNCQAFCRESEDDMGIVPVVPSDWIPDVTMLRRMLLKGSDANGNVWPPSLDSELCESIGEVGGTRDKDSNRELIHERPIVAQPLLGKKTVASSTINTVIPKVMCMVYTMADAHAGKIRVIRETWGGGCDGFLAFSTESDPRIPAISLPHDGPEEYNNMWQKVRSIWRFVGTHYLDDFDFFILGGDDLYVLPQNLRDYLSTVGSAEEDHFMGRRLKTGQHYFNSGGAGYTLSRGTLRKFMGMLDDKRCHPNSHTAQEDVMIAQCLMEEIGIDFKDTRDELGRERFHPYSPGGMLGFRPPKDKAFDWLVSYSKEWGMKFGLDCCAPDSVSFHYVKKPARVRHIHALLYSCPRDN